MDPWNCQPFQTPGINSPRNAFLLSLPWPLGPLPVPYFAVPLLPPITLSPSVPVFLRNSSPPPGASDVPLISSPSLIPLHDRVKHSQSFSPFCDSISADIAPVSLDSSIWSDEDAAEGNIFIRGEHKDGEEGRERGRETEREGVKEAE